MAGGWRFFPQRTQTIQTIQHQGFAEITSEVEQNILILSGKLTWKWKMNPLK